MADLTELVAAGPKGAKSRVTKLARTLPAAGLAPLFEDVCRAFLAEGEHELAQWCFAQARKAEKDHPALLDLDRVHTVFLELAAAGGVPPTAFRDHAKALADALPPPEAHARFREIVCAAFDAGRIPYARFFPDLRRLARAAKVRKRDEEEFLAERMLRAGVVPVASHQVWAAAREPLAAVAHRDEELLKLLVAAEPRPLAEHSPEVAEEIRQWWLEALAEAGAGAHLPDEWFFTVGRRCRAEVLLRLVDQAGPRLFDGAPQEPHRGPGPDPALPPPTDPEPALTGDELVRRAAAELSAGSLACLVEGFELLEPADLPPGRLREPHITDPIDALVTTLRSGIPAELAIPPAGLPRQRKGRTVVLQHEGTLAIADCVVYGHATASLPDGTQRGLRLWRLPEELDPWCDGESFHLSRVVDGRWQTFRADGDALDSLLLTLDPATRTVRPQAPGEAEVTFPGASAPSRVRLDHDEFSRTAPDWQSKTHRQRGTIVVTAPDGTVTARLAFSPLQGKVNGLVPPPGWWPRRAPLDPEGSAALRALDRSTAERLVTAGLRGPAAAEEAVRRWLPDITHPTLVEGVAAAVRTAVGCLYRADTLRRRAGLPSAPAVSPLLQTDPDFPVGDELGRLVSLRLMAADLRQAVAETAAPADPVLLRVVELPSVQYMLGGEFGRMAGYAYPCVWAWNARSRLPDLVRAWAASEWADGTGHWRLLELVSTTGRRQRGYGGQLWRTPHGALLVLHQHDDQRTVAVEYSPDGRFAPVELDGWAQPRPPVPQTWITRERVLLLDRLLTERGHATPDPQWALDLSERTGMGVLSALRLLFGDRLGRLPSRPSTHTHDRPDRTRLMPPDLTALIKTHADEAEEHAHGLTYPQIDLFREHLMPDDPTTLWTTGPDLPRAATWWLAFTRTSP
ncbi:MAG TPA: hypothetical protein VHJ17_16385 [Thermomonospora sp.]|nr:hypothetical protein [Thermomonospora sp.]